MMTNTSSFSSLSFLGDKKAIKHLLEFGFVVLFIVFGIFGVFFDVFASPPHLSGTITEGTTANYDQIPYPVHHEYNWYQGTYPTADEFCSYGSCGTTTQAICNNATMNLEIRLEPTACGGNGDYFDIIYLDGTPVGYFTYVRVSSTEWKFVSCDIENCNFCETLGACQNVGCCWYYSTWLHEWFCVSCPTGECGEGSPYEMCQNCFNEENCEAVENCYWFNGLCKFGTGECGYGLECQLCKTQPSCEAKECYWYDDFCWISEPIEVSSWFDYYAEHGDYATSSAFVNAMASTTEVIFRTLSGFLVGFTDIFDVREAIAQGENFGSVIPIARGHLNILNSFFGELPISQAFLFLITFLIAVGSFRLVRNIFNLIKFW